MVRDGDIVTIEYSMLSFMRDMCQSHLSLLTFQDLFAPRSPNLDIVIACYSLPNSRRCKLETVQYYKGS